MKIYQLYYPPISDSMPASSIAIGNFDGVHKGHQMVITEAMKLAHRSGLLSGVMTFDPHPKEVLGQVTHPSYLTPLTDKLNLFDRMGVDLTYIVRFTHELSFLTPEQFIEHFILRLNIKQVVTGYDFRFGRQGKGNVDTLRQWSQQNGGFVFDCVHKMKLGEEKISSTLVRSLLERGKVSQVVDLLGRPYRITGRVVSGEKRGRTIGFPTANLSLSQPYVIPRNGVYAVLAVLRGRQIPGVVNIGTKPTFHPGGQSVSIEAHLFDFNDNIYGEILSIDFIHFLREERKFASAENLQEQISRDVRRAKTLILDSTNR